MKKSIAWLLYLGIGLSSLCLNTTLANTVYRDTVIINAGANLKVFIIGNELGDVLKYHRADSIKTLFMNDLQRAIEIEQPINGRENHYLVHSSGKRRFKMESEDFQEPGFQLARETRHLDLALPNIAYYLYDLAADVQIHVFVANVDKLKEFYRLNLNDLVALPKPDRYTLRRATAIELKWVETQWNVLWHIWPPKDNLELTSLFGASLIGSQASPEVGIKFALMRADKYGEPSWSVGLTYNFNMLADYSNKEFTNMHVVRTLNVNFMKTYGNDNTGSWRWIGLQAGYVHLSPGTLNNSIRIGFLTTYHSLQLGFHTYFLSGSNAGKVLYGVSFNF